MLLAPQITHHSLYMPHWKKKKLSHGNYDYDFYYDPPNDDNNYHDDAYCALDTWQMCNLPDAGTWMQCVSLGHKGKEGDAERFDPLLY